MAAKSKKTRRLSSVQPSSIKIPLKWGSIRLGRCEMYQGLIQSRISLGKIDQEIFQFLYFSFSCLPVTVYQPLVLEKVIRRGKGRAGEDIPHGNGICQQWKFPSGIIQYFSRAFTSIVNARIALITHARMICCTVRWIRVAIVKTARCVVTIAYNFFQSSLLQSLVNFRKCPNILAFPRIQMGIL